MNSRQNNFKDSWLFTKCRRSRDEVELVLGVEAFVRFFCISIYSSVEGGTTANNFRMCPSYLPKSFKNGLAHRSQVFIYVERRRSGLAFRRSYKVTFYISLAELHNKATSIRSLGCWLPSETMGRANSSEWKLVSKGAFKDLLH